jgi:ABC-2 type transport system ATP-binding protein
VTPGEAKGRTAGFEVESAQGEDVRRELARAIVTRGWGLLELRPLRMSLEDVFLKLTTQESDAATASDVVASEQAGAQAEVAHE